MKQIKLVSKIMVVLLTLLIFNANDVDALSTIIGADGETKYEYEDCAAEGEDDGKSLTDINGIKACLTYYYSTTGYVGAGVCEGIDFTHDGDQWTWGRNETYGWAEVINKSTNTHYALFAGATHNLVKGAVKKELSGINHIEFWAWKFKHIYYFEYWDTFQFKIDQTVSGHLEDTTVYNAIILDDCNVSMWPQAPQSMTTITSNYSGYDGNQFIRNGVTTYNEFDVFCRIFK